MRILHLSDLHIGSSGVWDRVSDNGWPQSLGEDEKLLWEVVWYAIHYDIDAVLFTGDAYKSRNPSPTQQGVFAKVIARLSARGIPTILLPGNHDKPGICSYNTTLDIYGDVGLASVTVCSVEGTYHIETKAGPLSVVAFPWGTFNPDQARYFTERLGPAPAVLLAHLSILDCHTGTEQGMILGKETVWPIEAVAHEAFDYVALGHIHRHQAWYCDNGVTVAYAGSLQRLDFGDEDDTKGFYVVDLGRTEHAVEPEFVPVQAREFLTLNWTDLPLATALDRDKIVRVQANLTEEEAAKFSDEQVRAWLQNAHHVSIQKTIQRDRKTRADSTITTMSPIAALEQYLTIKEYTPERIKELSERAKEMM